MAGMLRARENRLITVEGLIGSGKSTLLKRCAEYFPQTRVIPERVSEWQNLATKNGPVNLLEKFYADPGKLGFAFQVHVLQTLAASHVDTLPPETPRMSERSVHSSVQLFGRLLMDKGHMDATEFAILSGWYDLAKETLPVNPKFVLYVDTTPTVALERIRLRGRPEESGITLAYLIEQKLYQEQLFYQNVYCCEVIRLSGDKPAEEVFQQVLTHSPRLFL